jgi:hypothetical protein
MRYLLSLLFLGFSFLGMTQVQWVNVDSLYQPLPSSVHVYRTTDSLEGKPNISYYLEADVNNRSLIFSADTTLGRRLKPSAYYERNEQALVVVNTSFFSFATNQNLNIVMKDGKLVSYNVHALPRRGKDTLTYNHPFTSAIGISKKWKLDIAWVYTDSAVRIPFASQDPVAAFSDSLADLSSRQVKNKFPSFKKWKMRTAVGGGPVLLQNGKIKITNNEELKFGGKAINDRHPRTAMGYKPDGKLIILVVEGRFPGRAEGASLVHLAEMFRDIGCVEALNLDGGGSSCMLVNGKETIRVSDSNGQRPVPAVFIIKSKK